MRGFSKFALGKVSFDASTHQICKPQPRISSSLLIIEGIGKTIGVGITGVSSFVYNPIVSKGTDPNTCFVTWLNKAGI